MLLMKVSLLEPSAACMDFIFHAFIAEKYFAPIAVILPFTLGNDLFALIALEFFRKIFQGKGLDLLDVVWVSECLKQIEFLRTELPLSKGNFGQSPR